MRIRKKLVLAFSLVTLPPFFGLLGYVLYTNQQQIERSGATVESQAIDLIDAVQRDVRRAMAEVRSWAVGSRISHRALAAAALPTAKLQEHWVSNAYLNSPDADLLRDLKNISGDRFAEIFFTDPRGNVVASSNATSDFGQGPETDPPDGETWWAEARDQQLRRGEITRDESAGIYSIDLSIALWYDGRFAGVLKAVYNVESLLENIGKSSFGQSGHAILVDRQGNVIAAPGRFASILFSEASNVRNFEANHLVQTQTSGYTFENVPWVGGKALIGVAPAVRMDGADNHNMLADIGWSAMVIVPVEEALFSARQIYLLGALTLGAVLLAMLAAVVILSTRISNPLVEISQTVSQFEGGSLHLRVPHEGNDEVGTLATAINRMTKRLANYEAMNIETIKQLNVDLGTANRRLEQLATTDALTGLVNRRVFYERLDEEIVVAVRSTAPLSLILIDLDHFKEINDAHGHLAGDEILRNIGLLLLRSIRKSDTAARYGGEELAVILPGAGPDQAWTAADKLRQLIAREVVAVGGVELRVTASLGVASADWMDIPDAASMVAVADAALYRAKHAGRDRIECAFWLEFGDVVAQ